MRTWSPVVVLLVGCLLLTGVGRQLAMDLRQPLAAALPDDLDGWGSEDVVVSEEEAAVAGFTDYALRVYEEPGAEANPSAKWVSVYLGYYDQQSRGRTIHSPRNCLPGAGWETVSMVPESIVVGNETVVVNRALLQNGNARSLVLYWYQGRGRVAHNEYLVKWDLLRDAMLHRRTDEALVRIVVPVLGDADEEAAMDIARRVAARLKPALDEALPAAT